MSPKIASNIRLDPELLEGMRSIREALGIPVSEQVRRAVNEWLQRMLPEAARQLKAQFERDMARTAGVLDRAERLVAARSVKKTPKTRTARKRAGTR
jgi:Arc/MetJ-type ribon-helix-helix transcriptional regulator